ncbi:MAG TPA: AMP-binding protein [Longimicrobium sp.]|nr:AMP-binding protein [Longimicrobium sp.]
MSVHLTHPLDTLIAAAAREAPERPALAADPPATAHELERRVHDFAGRLRGLGVHGGRLGLLLPNVPAFPTAFFGTLRAGCSVVMLNPLLSRREAAEYLADSKARGVVTIEAMEHLVPEGVPKLCVDAADGSLETGFDAAPYQATPDGPLPRGGREAVVIYTSAMDGWARGARLTHTNLAANLRGVVEAMQLTPDDCVLGLLPWVHAFGLTATLNAPLAAGSRVVPFERFHPVRVLSALEETGATVLCGVPATYVALISAAERQGVPAHRLRVAVCGGAPLRAEVARRWEETFGIPLREGYGITECGPVCLFNRVDRPNRPGTLGYPFPGVEVTVRGPRGEDVPHGQTGEICVEGANVFPGYVGDAGRDPEHFWDNAFRTGDLGCVEADGAVRFRGVKKRMFTRAGFNVYPAEVERALCGDPRIAEVSVTAAPDPVKENEVVVTVVPAPGAELDEAAVKEICRERLAGYKQPGVVVIES